MITQLTSTYIIHEFHQISILILHRLIFFPRVLVCFGAIRIHPDQLNLRIWGGDLNESGSGYGSVGVVMSESGSGSSEMCWIRVDPQRW